LECALDVPLLRRRQQDAGKDGEEPDATLGVPLRQHNALLVAAGFAPIWRETEFAAPELMGVRRALDYILSQQEPFPAAAVDRRWNLLQANDGAVRLLPAPRSISPTRWSRPDVLRPYLTNWPDVVRYFIRSVEADAMADGTAETAALLERLIRYKGVRAVLRTRAADLAAATAGPVLPMRFRKGAVALELFTTIATLGTPQDITLQELRIESFFPMDADTARVLRAWAKPKRTRARQGGPRSGQPQIGQL
jgi:hypothetical protein